MDTIPSASHQGIYFQRTYYDIIDFLEDVEDESFRVGERIPSMVKPPIFCCGRDQQA
ncbi:hypothetical protein FA13DRAFT_1725778 [Coprinellus micaceus]|uniref:Uncharacterized protein n=1 Tax=Coprinellus micaceus TaxID=71717 RepID=A0A4Y7TWZ4_COPMI|nr:hypothetical protein FA13DRAFT_1725778 [Coprinellus micaceus]